MLLNNLYKIQNIHSTEKHLVDIEIIPSHEIFLGHFPNNPVMPGVCLIQIIKECTEQITGKELQMLTGDNIKFTAVLDPRVHGNVKVSISLKEKENGSLQADASVFYGEISFFSFKGSFRDK